MLKPESSRYFHRILIAASLLWTIPSLSGCRDNSSQLDHSITDTSEPATDTTVGEVEEIDELAGIPEISMAELAESMDAETLYIDNCAKCHGLTGLGDGPSVGSLSTQSGLNLTILDDMSDDEINQIISVGKGMEMPPWELLLSPQQLESLTQYVRSLVDS